MRDNEGVRPEAKLLPILESQVPVCSDFLINEEAGQSDAPSLDSSEKVDELYKQYFKRVRTQGSAKQTLVCLICH